jgi:hypothetical protein
MGVVVFGVIALYLAVSFAVVLLTVRAAKKKGKSPLRRGGMAVLVMYLLVFWDHIPTIVAHKYYCEKEAGFWVYKTVEQWKTENSAMAERLTWRKYPLASDIVTRSDGTRQQMLNERFSLDMTDLSTPLLSTTKHEEKYVDIKTGEVLAKRISVSSGYGELAVGGKDWRIIKFWLSLDPCIPEKEKFGSFFRAVHQMGSKK